VKTFTAPWGTALRWSSFGLVALAVAIIAGSAWMSHGAPRSSIWLAAGSMPLILLCCLPFVVRGYTISGDELLIRRLFWTTRLPLTGLKSAESVPQAMSKSRRTCGNGGGFSFTGWYWNKALGSYRAFVTDLNRTVVLRFEKRTVVVSPAEPEDFVRKLAPQPS